MALDGRGSSTCLLCDQPGLLIQVLPFLIQNIRKLFGCGNEYNNLLRNSKICLSCTGRLFQLIEFMLVEEAVKGKPQDKRCNFCFSEYVMPLDLLHAAEDALMQTRWSKDYRKEKRLACCYSCCQFFQFQAELGRTLREQLMLFLSRISQCTVKDKRCSDDDSDAESGTVFPEEAAVLAAQHPPIAAEEPQAIPEVTEPQVIPNVAEPQSIPAVVDDKDIVSVPEPEVLQENPELSQPVIVATTQVKPDVESQIISDTAESQVTPVYAENSGVSPVELEVTADASTKLDKKETKTIIKSEQSSSFGCVELKYNNDGPSGDESIDKEPNLGASTEKSSHTKRVRKSTMLERLGIAEKSELFESQMEIVDKFTAIKNRRGKDRSNDLKELPKKRKSLGNIKATPDQEVQPTKRSRHSFSDLNWSEKAAQNKEMMDLIKSDPEELKIEKEPLEQTPVVPAKAFETLVTAEVDDPMLELLRFKTPSQEVKIVKTELVIKTEETGHKLRPRRSNDKVELGSFQDQLQKLLDEKKMKSKDSTDIQQYGEKAILKAETFKRLPKSKKSQKVRAAKASPPNKVSHRENAIKAEKEMFKVKSPEKQNPDPPHFQEIASFDAQNNSGQLDVQTNSSLTAVIITPSTEIIFDDLISSEVTIGNPVEPEEPEIPLDVPLQQPTAEQFAQYDLKKCSVNLKRLMPDEVRILQAPKPVDKERFTKSGRKCLMPKRLIGEDISLTEDEHELPVKQKKVVKKDCPIRMIEAKAAKKEAQKKVQEPTEPKETPKPKSKKKSKASKEKSPKNDKHNSPKHDSHKHSRKSKHEVKPSDDLVVTFQDQMVDPNDFLNAEFTEAFVDYASQIPDESTECQNIVERPESPDVVEIIPETGPQIVRPIRVVQATLKARGSAQVANAVSNSRVRRSTFDERMETTVEFLADDQKHKETEDAFADVIATIMRRPLKK